jgi:hypothetical protein
MHGATLLRTLSRTSRAKWPRQVASAFANPHQTNRMLGGLRLKDSETIGRGCTKSGIPLEMVKEGLIKSHKRGAGTSGLPSKVITALFTRSFLREQSSEFGSGLEHALDAGVHLLFLNKLATFRRSVSLFDCGKEPGFVILRGERRVHGLMIPVAFFAGLSERSTLRTSSGIFRGSSLNPSCSRIAVSTTGRPSRTTSVESRKAKSAIVSRRTTGLKRSSNKE